MARPTKEGIDYFPMDVDFFEDDKLQLIEAEFGEKGLMVTIKLMCKIYKENGYYYQWGEDQCLLFSKNAGAGFVPSLVNEVVKGLVRRSFFDKGVFDKFKILTSKGFQKRYFEATKKRKDVSVFQDYLVIDNINSINSNINSINVTINTQSKVKESKVKEKKESVGDKSPARSNLQISLPERKLEFKNQLKPFVETYGSEMMNKFYSYWTEKNKPGTKMKFELEKTWELPKRLATWASRETGFKKPIEKTNDSQVTMKPL